MDEKKYTSLEHTIRNIVKESVGVSGSDKFQGTPKSFLKPAPVIKPKVGDSHPDETSVLSQRGNAKIQNSQTMKNEEVLDEAGGVNTTKKPDNASQKILKDLNTPTPEYLKKKKEYDDWKQSKDANPLPDLSKDNAKKEWPTPPPEMPSALDALNKPTIDVNAKPDPGSIKPIQGGALGWYAQRAKDKLDAFGRTLGANLGKDVVVGAGKYGMDKIAPSPIDQAAGKSSWEGAGKEWEKLKGSIGKEAEITQGYRTMEPKVAQAADVASVAAMVAPELSIGKAGEVASATGTAAKGVETAGETAAKVKPPVAAEVPPPVKMPEIPLNKTISDIMKRPKDLEVPASNQNVAGAGKPAAPAEVKPPPAEKPSNVSEFPGKKGSKRPPEDQAPQPETQGNLALKPKENMAPSDAEQTYKFDKPANDKVADIKKYSNEGKPPKVDNVGDAGVGKPENANVPGAGKPEAPVDADVKPPAPPAEVKAPSKQSVDTKKLYGQPKPPSIKDAGNQNVSGAGKPAAPAAAPGKKAGTSSVTTPGQSPAAAPSASPATSAPAAAPAAAPATVTQPAPAAQTATQPAPAAQPAPAPAPQTNPNTKPPEEEEGNNRRRNWRMPKLPSLKGAPLPGKLGSVPVSTFLHRSAYASVLEDADANRRAIKNVARPEDKKANIGKQGQIQTKIIENSEKIDVIKRVRKEAAEKSTIIKNPKLKHPELDQN